MRGFIDDRHSVEDGFAIAVRSQSAFVRGFIDDVLALAEKRSITVRLNPRSCAASSMTRSP